MAKKKKSAARRSTVKSTARKSAKAAGKPAGSSRSGTKGRSEKKSSSRKKASTASSRSRGARSGGAQEAEGASAEFVARLKAERRTLEERLSQIDALLASYGESPECFAQRVSSFSGASAAQWIQDVIEEGGHKWEELVKKFEDSNTAQKLAGLEAALRDKYFKKDDDAERDEGR